MKCVSVRIQAAEKPQESRQEGDLHFKEAIKIGELQNDGKVQ